MVLPIYATLERLDPALVEAAADLGARPLDHRLARRRAALQARHSSPASVLVFIPCLGAYLTPDLLGGGRTVMVGNLVQNQFTTARDWPFGSAVSHRADGAGDRCCSWSFCAAKARRWYEALARALRRRHSSRSCTCRC